MVWMLQMTYAVCFPGGATIVCLLMLHRQYMRITCTKQKFTCLTEQIPSVQGKQHRQKTV